MTTLALERPRERTRPFAFAAVWFALTAPLSLAAAAWQASHGRPAADVLELVTLAPAVAAGLTWLAFRRWLPAGAPALAAPAFARTAASAVGWALAFYVVVAVLAGGPGTLPAADAGTPLAVVIALQVLGALGEELGYRGVLLTALLHRYPARTAAVANGVVFGIVHVGYWSLGPAQVGMFVLATVALVVAMTALYRGSFWQRMATTTIVHAGSNLALFAVGDAASMWRVAVAMWAATGVLLLVRVRMREDDQRG